MKEYSKTIMSLSLVLLVSLLSACTDSDEARTTGDSSLKLKSPVQTCKLVDVQYQVQEEYIDKEPYQATEEYQQNLKFEVNNPQTSTTLHGFDVWATGDVPVRNVDAETGTFTVQQTFETLDGSRTYSSSQYIMPGETKIFHEEHDIDSGEDVRMTYSVTPGQKTMTRQITRYRDVTKYRTVTKTRQEEQCN